MPSGSARAATAWRAASAWAGMRERAELVGGELEFGPAPGGGTTVRLTVPLAGRPRRAGTRRSCC